LKELDINPSILDSGSRLSKDGLVFPDHDKLTAAGQKPSHTICYTTHEGLQTYCKYNFNPNSLSPIHVDQSGKKYFLHDLMFLRYYMMSGGKEKLIGCL
jgi:hypothetical protein